MPDSFRFDGSLSRSQADKPRVRRLAERLRAAGLRLWFDEWVIKPGDDIYLAIERGLEASRTLACPVEASQRRRMLCLSPAALGSDWVGLERSTVLFRDPSNVRRCRIRLWLEESGASLLGILRRASASGGACGRKARERSISSQQVPVPSMKESRLWPKSSKSIYRQR